MNAEISNTLDLVREDTQNKTIVVDRGVINQTESVEDSTDDNLDDLINNENHSFRNTIDDWSDDNAESSLSIQSSTAFSHVNKRKATSILPPNLVFSSHLIESLTYSNSFSSFSSEDESSVEAINNEDYSEATPAAAATLEPILREGDYYYFYLSCCISTINHLHIHHITHSTLRYQLYIDHHLDHYLTTFLFYFIFII